MESMIEAYGPYAFGLLSLMVLWHTIVKPQLRVQETQSLTMKLTADSNRETALILKEVTSELKELVYGLKVIEAVHKIQ